jgi:hypothetical protein
MRLVCALAVATAVLACERAPTTAEATSRWPASTVMVVGGKVPIFASDVDPYLPALALIEPRFVEKQLMRVALTNVVLPRAIATVLAGDEARAKARKAADDALATLRDGTWVGPAAPGSTGGAVIEGSFVQLGIVKWANAFELQPGEWSGVVEETGCFTITKCLERIDGRLPIQTSFRLEVVVFPYLPAEIGPLQIEEAYDTVRLEILDPEWRSIVPELTQYRMGVHSP